MFSRNNIAVHNNRISVSRLVEVSLQVITDHQDSSGAYPASPAFSAYQGYSWLRDGSFTADAMSRWDRVESANRFHYWVNGVLLKRSSQVEELIAAKVRGDQLDLDQMLPTRFTFAGDNGNDDWWDFQTDGYGMWLWTVIAHARRHHLDLASWLPGMQVAVDYLLAFGDLPCFDWWEEHSEHTHTSTLAAVHAGLREAATVEYLGQDRCTQAAAAANALRDMILARGTTTDDHGTHLTKWFGATNVDASLLSCVVPYGLLDVNDPIAVATVAAVAADLDFDGGVHRFTADVFYGGGQWPLLSCLLGSNRAAAGDRDSAQKYLEWAAAQADFDGLLPEQVTEHLLHPESRDEWIQRWGTVAQPLLWSHAMYLILAQDLGITPHLTGKDAGK